MSSTINATTPTPATPEELAALRRLIDVAQGDTGQARRAANFLLSWWNAGSCGGFDLTDLWSVDGALARDMLTVVGLVARCRAYPPALDPDFRADFVAILHAWRPALMA